MAIEMIMPKVDMDQETGMVVEWLKEDGQKVEKGETILVIETDKITIDVEAPGTGILANISAQPGDTVPIGTVIAYILEEGETLTEEITEYNLPEVQISPDTIETKVSATSIAAKIAADFNIDLIRPI